MYFDHRGKTNRNPRRLQVMYCELPEKVEQWFLGQKWIEDWLPPWVTELYIKFSTKPSLDGADIESMVDYNYRNVKLTVFPHWLMIEDALQRRCLIHELGHVVIGPMQCWIEELMDHVLKDQEDWESKMIRQEYNNRLEQTVCDLAEVMETKDDRT